MTFSDCLKRLRWNIPFLDKLCDDMQLCGRDLIQGIRRADKGLELDDSWKDREAVRVRSLTERWGRILPYLALQAW